MESRASKRFAGLQSLYLPFIFSSYGVLLGTVYFQTRGASNILASFGVLSCASGLFMFPVIYVYLFGALDVRMYLCMYLYWLVGGYGEERCTLLIHFSYI